MVAWKPYRGLSQSAIEHIVGCRRKGTSGVYPVLKRIQAITGVPWQAMAGIWYRESFSVTPPKTPGGPWQFDPVPPRSALNTLLERFATLSYAERMAILDKGVNDFFAGGVLAACFLKTKTRYPISPNCDPAFIKDALYGYNGRKYGSADRSPYVMNGYDEAHFEMNLRGTIPDGKGGRKWVDIIDRRPGAFTVYRQLKELFP